MRTEFLCISLLRVASGPRVKLASCKSALIPPVVCSTDRSKAVVPVLVLLFVALWFILRGDLLYVFPCVILFLCFSVLLVLRLPRLGKRELILVLFVRLFGLFLFRFVGFLFLLGSGKGCVLWLWHSLDFSLTFLSSNTWFGYLLESPHSNKYHKHMFYDEIRIKQGLSYKSFWPLRILYNSKFILMATSLGTNTVVVTRVYCTSLRECYTFSESNSYLAVILPTWQPNSLCTLMPCIIVQ